MPSLHNYENQSGVTDLTAYTAIRNIYIEKKRKCIKEIQAVARKHGFFIYSQIKLCDFDDERSGENDRSKRND